MAAVDGGAMDEGKKKEAANAISGAHITEDENIYEVEKIVGMSVMDGQTMYRVRWLNYSPQHDTWEPYKNLITCKDLVEEYLSRRTEQRKRKRTSEEKAMKRKLSDSDKTEEEREETVGSLSPDKPVEGKQLKDTFWKDLEEGRINVFEQDMYSKVKGRSARHQQSNDDVSPPKGKKSTAANKPSGSNSNTNSPDPAAEVSTSPKEYDQQKTKRHKKRKKQATAENFKSASTDDVESAATIERAESPTSVSAPVSSVMEKIPTVRVSRIDSASISRALESEDKDVQSNNASTPSTTEQQLNNDEDELVSPHVDENAKETKMEITEKQQNLENERLTSPVANGKPSTVTSMTKDSAKEIKAVVPAKGLASRYKCHNRLTETACCTRVQAYKSRDSRKNLLHERQIRRSNKIGTGDIAYRFEFSRYNPEEWITQDATASDQCVQISNAEFRDAVKRGDYELLRRALNGNHKNNLEQTDLNGTTLLMIAAESGFDDVVELLSINGAHINAVQKNGATALMLAADLGHICSVAVLLGLGAHVNITQHSGETALMKACKRGYRPIVQLLLEQGADFAMVTNSDTTALKLAKQYDHPSIQHQLTDHISRVTAAFESQVNITMNNTAFIVHALFPLHCFSLNEATSFRINFNYQLQPSEPGVGMLLFIAHSRITSQEVKCRFYGPCAVICALLNSVRQSSLTEEANFVLSFSPLKNGKNELVINTIPTSSSSKAKLLVCAYKAKLMGNSKLS